MCRLLRVLTPVPDSMVLITDKFWGPSGADNVIGSVHLWLAEAIDAFQDNRDTLTAKVRAGGAVGKGGVSRRGLVPLKDPCGLPQVIQGCGNPKVNPHGSGTEEKRPRGKLVLQKPPAGALEKLVSGPSAGPALGGGGMEGRLGQGTQWPDCCSAGLGGQSPAPRRPGLLDQPPRDAVQRKDGHEHCQ